MGRFIQGMEKLEMTVFAFRLDITNCLEPGVVIDIRITDLLEFGQRRGNGIIKLADVVGRDFVFAERGLDLIHQVDRIAFE